MPPVAYERLKGRAHFAVDPKAPAQAGIVDLDKAPVDADGLVRLSSRHLDPEAGRSGARATAGCSSTGATAATSAACSSSTTPSAPTTRARPRMPATASCMRRGYTLAWVGWQADLLPGDASLPARRAGGDRQRQADHRPGARRVHRQRARHHDHAAVAAAPRRAAIRRSRSTRARRA